MITGLGVAAPKYSIAQSDACEITHVFNCENDEQRRKLTAIYLRSGVRERGSVLLRGASGSLAERGEFFAPRRDADDRGPSTAERMERYEQDSLPLAVRACRAALDDAGQDPHDITHLVTASCSGFSAPGFDLGLVRELGMKPGTQRTNVGFMGCHGGFNALRVADAFATSSSRATVLVCSLELCSLHHFYGWDPEKIVANGLFADGSGAAVVRADAGQREPQFKLLRQGSTVVEESAAAMSWKIGDHGFEMTLSQALPALIKQNLAPWMKSFLAAEKLTIESIGAWAIHPGGPRILDACREALGLDEPQLAASREVLAEHGNMSSATVYFVLDRLRRMQCNRPVVALGFGPGLTIEAMILA
jgi:predicted naringenin-chalcone synthase